MAEREDVISEVRQYMPYVVDLTSRAYSQEDYNRIYAWLHDEMTDGVMWQDVWTYDWLDSVFLFRNPDLATLFKLRWG